MSQPVHVDKNYRTYRGEMGEAMNAALPKRNPVLGVLIGFACTITLIGAVASLIQAYFAGG